MQIVSHHEPLAFPSGGPKIQTIRWYISFPNAFQCAANMNNILFRNTSLIPCV
jgi:hypothetical protein